MTAVRIQLFNAHKELLATYDAPVKDEFEVDHVGTTALIKLLRNSWSVTPGDVIRINKI
jgi:hypothetical protein